MILDLGLIDYEAACRIQKEFVARRKSGCIEDSIVLAEHKAVFTIGRTGLSENLLEREDVLRESGIKVIRVDRGGDITFHGPGQLVIYPIVDLKSRGRDMHKYMRDLEEAAIRALRDYAVFGERIHSKTGVWIGEKKIASVGVGASNWITFHGISLNIDCDLSFYNMINPCGMKGVKMTSLGAILNRGVAMDGAKERVIPYFIDIFGIEGQRYVHREETALVA
ncbi:MAG: lipoyl(octanoyl) transferase LipB [Candidatus Omnitrophota bacterium]